MKSKNWNSANIPIDSKLRDYFNSSHAAYVRWKREQEQEAKRREIEELESTLFLDLEREKKTQQAPQHSATWDELNSTLRKKEEEQRKLTEIAEEALKKAKEGQKELQDLRKRRK